mmetsp:Transcript_76468/g.199348  ORF Transcript_76468/g.199348 Transcript_76468/m.199348 type:complete len:274 (-) Transcript_76468:3-824(-)
MHLHHRLHRLAGLVARERLHGLALALAHPGLRVAVHLLESLPQLALADRLRRCTQAVDGIHQRDEQLVDLAEHAAELGLPERLHGVDDLLELGAAQQLGLVLQRRDLRHEVRHGALDVVERQRRRGRVLLLCHDGGGAPHQQAGPLPSRRARASAGKHRRGREATAERRQACGLPGLRGGGGPAAPAQRGGQLGLLGAAAGGGRALRCVGCGAGESGFLLRPRLLRRPAGSQQHQPLAHRAARRGELPSLELGWRSFLGGGRRRPARWRRMAA